MMHPLLPDQATVGCHSFLDEIQGVETHECPYLVHRMT
jgi:hypothetical protein